MTTDIGKTRMLNEIQETPYGIKKRLQFIYSEVAQRLNNVEDVTKIRILDIGCGTGELITIPVGALGVTVLGIDTHLPSIEHARQKNPFPNVQFEHIPVAELADQQFDLIICSEVLEHLREPAAMLMLIKKYLKRDGRCIITIPNGYSLKEIEVRLYKAISRLGLASLFRYLGKPARKSERQPGQKDTLSQESPHIQFFSMGRFKSLLGKCELSIVERENRRFLDGFLVNRIFSASKSLINWNVSVAHKIPYPLASSWMFLVEHNRRDPEH